MIIKRLNRLSEELRVQGVIKQVEVIALTKECDLFAVLTRNYAYVPAGYTARNRVEFKNIASAMKEYHTRVNNLKKLSKNES